MALTKVTSGVRTLGTGEVATANMAVDPTNASNLASGTVPTARMPSTGTSWQAITTAATLTAVAGNGYPINTTSNACTVTLPASASVGDTIEFVDYLRTWGTNSVTINPNSLKYQGFTTPQPNYNISGESLRIIYVDATQGWVPVFDGSVIFETAQDYTCSFLCIAGGGGSGGLQANYVAGGGGGAGGYRNSYASEASGGGASTESTIALTREAVYTVTVGAGGTAGANNATPGGVGEDSVISGLGITTITSVGGGGGGSSAAILRAATAGGSGGGGTENAGDSGKAGTANQGYAGSDAGGGSDTNAGCGGGGGAAAAATDATNSTAGIGGAGLDNTITGASVARGGGGGGGQKLGSSDNPTSPSTTATHGGGNAAAGNNNGNPGTVNTGGGAGGASGVQSTPERNGAAGGTGIVILRIPTAEYTSTTTGSPTVTTDGTDTIIAFTGDGTYTA